MNNIHGFLTGVSWNEKCHKKNCNGIIHSAVRESLQEKAIKYCRKCKEIYTFDERLNRILPIKSKTCS